MNYTPKDIYDLVSLGDVNELKRAFKQSNESMEWFKHPNLWTAVHQAASNSSECLEILLDHGADIEAKTMILSTPLIVAACNENIDCVKLLLSKGANIEHRDENGKNALHHASHGCRLCAIALIDAGANINAIDFNGDTALDICGYSCIGCDRHSDRPECFQVLLDRGAVMGNTSLNGYFLCFQTLVHQRKAQFTSFIDTYVPFVPWRKLLRSRVFPRGSNPHVPDMGWVRADRLCDKFYHDEVFFLLQLIIAKVYATRLPSAITRMTRGMSKKCVSSIPQYLSRNSDKTHLLMELLSRELSEYLHFPK